MSPESHRPTVVLVGPPGAGKTTVGTALAQHLATRFTDSDALIEARAGSTIAEIFTRDGEDVFRALEREVVAELLAAGEGVLALGGGAVLAADTRERLRGHRVVHLTVGLADGLRRTGLSTARPLLAGVNPRATFKALLDARAPLYREVAAVEVDTSRRSPEQVTRAVLEALGEDVTGLPDAPGPDAPGPDAPAPDRADLVDARDGHRSHGPAPLPDPTLRPGAREP
jgi:shikimate kinase